MKKSQHIKSARLKEFTTPEKCLITEVWNVNEDEELSIARARVKKVLPPNGIT